MSLGSEWLDFLLIAGLTAVVIFVAAGLVLRLTAWARTRRRSADATPAGAGREVAGADHQVPSDVEAPGAHGFQQ